MNNTPPALTTIPTTHDPAAPMTSGEVAAEFGVTTTTVKRWCERGLLSFFRTPGGHYRFQSADVARLKSSGFTHASGAA